MDQRGFVRLALVAIAVVVLSFVVLGLSRLVVGYRTAQLLAAPIGAVGFLLAVALFVRATLSAVGIWTIEPVKEEGEEEEETNVATDDSNASPNRSTRE